MKLRFPLLGGGVAQGLNDAGIETFEGDYAHYTVRECTQNSLDAAASHDEPVRVEIDIYHENRTELPFMDDLRAALRGCKEFWRGHAKPREFFERAERLAGRDDLYLLRISDFGTTGVPGDDDDNTKPWYGLVRSRGVSIKAEEDSGGAFGIGKDAPLAASTLRTVLYSTKTDSGDVALQGICRLATHQGDTDKTQGTGFIGNYDRRSRTFTAIRNEDDIPSLFRRSEPGLDVWIVGFHFTEDWENEFVAAALRNFWPAIHFGRLSLKIGRFTIDGTTLPTLMHELRNTDAVREALPYFEAATAPGMHSVDEHVATAGRCRLFLSIGDRELPRRICMTRKTGMVIYYYPPGTVRVPFAGLFCCDDPRGNRLLKALEPPSHDKWVQKRAETPAEKDVLKQIKAWINLKLRAMIPDLESSVINEDSIADPLPDDLPGPSDSAGDDTDLGGRPVPPGEITSPEPVVPRSRTPSSGSGSRGTDPAATGGGEGDTTDPQEGDGASTGGRTDRSGGEQPPGGGAMARQKIDLRSYRSRDDEAVYHIVARAGGDHSGNIRIDAVTEDGGTVSCPLAAAYDESGTSLAVHENCISGVTLSTALPLRLRIVLRHPLRVALRASTT